jgi:hypothetical protein
MGEYEPDDSRTVTQSPHRAPGEPPRTGPREDEARARARNDESEAVERRGSATARDAYGRKEPGYAEKAATAPEPDEDSVPLGK